ncbi:hypothetical protein H7H82_08325 [Mycobacterium heidelbergense]|uniref:Uncharacterized protein n=1 Tax=Mycobacterium heidelbergense TaxID=53376 RepID=A0A1X0DJR2_MYCHE|nr:hypothetical protein [Mycobacterium heidelbergense]MCV7050600.1 hypothetical protein [Mycobacterium heidelbergense]ORA72070.1 hypothetical protein BST25_15275 [Mycobacterium heidelbergense]
MTMLALYMNQDKRGVVGEAGRTMEEFVVLTDEHGGVHVPPRHLYDAVAARRTHLRKVLTRMLERKNEGLNGLEPTSGRPGELDIFLKNLGPWRFRVALGDRFRNV